MAVVMEGEIRIDGRDWRRLIRLMSAVNDMLKELSTYELESKMEIIGSTVVIWFSLKEGEGSEGEVGG
ncbi:MAG: hypothetical protein NZ992_00700 [Candidatus Korarchaeum sp.]|nr:hypothetical protein [Candidatus Korarchaeum sp.]MDW8035515.1 hypothetical protein [Candidatus Korarchaeum sp.]